MPPARRVFDLDWRRISRWCCLGTIVMALWLLFPVARCSVDVFRETPLSTIDGAPQPADADKARVEEAQGFFGTLVDGVEVCYAKTPLFGQESWKSNLLVGFGAATVLTWLAGRMLNRRGGTVG